MTPDPALDEAFAAAPRTRFLPRKQRRFAGLDQPLPIGWGQTNSQPRTVRTMLALLDVRTGQRVLDVGCGSAWTTALLARLVGPTGEVIGVEIVPELVAFGRANLTPFGLGWAGVHAADPDVLGRPAQAPYDRILVSAEARSLPWDLADQLAADGGVMVVPVDGELLLVRQQPGRAHVERHGAYAFVPLVGG
jgi:protein-L-isoaspartate(D-aspartate) O-methyltransferase